MVYLSTCLCHPQYMSSVYHSFQSTGLSPSLVRFICRYFIIFHMIANGIAFLTFFSVTSVLVYKNAMDFYTLILYHAILLIHLPVLVVF